MCVIDNFWINKNSVKCCDFFVYLRLIILNVKPNYWHVSKITTNMTVYDDDVNSLRAVQRRHGHSVCGLHRGND